MTKIYFDIQIDCEATQHAINDADLGKRSILGLGEIFRDTGMKGSFMVIPGDIKAHKEIYKTLADEGHDIGLHIHPADQGYQEFLGVYGFDDQVKIIQEGMAQFAEVMGHDPESFTPGYGSANDHTFLVLESVGLKQGLVSIPTRDLPACACVWGSSPLGCHYPHRFNRCLDGDVDFVNVPGTIDPDSRMWGGKHPQDLRVELVDAKNHYYTIEKALKRQLQEDTPVKYIKALTHNIFDYSDKNNFRCETLLGIIDAAKRICEQNNCKLIAANNAEIAAEYRHKVKLPDGGVELTLDTRGR
ncbi:MAG: polysaccharide deacetylase family protein [Planctomycetota bacterium]